MEEDGSNCKGCIKCGKNSSKKIRTKTTDNFIFNANLVHGDTYNYSKTKYIKSDKHVTIICYEHGEFNQIASVHLKGSGCPTCGRFFHYKENNEIKKKERRKITIKEIENLLGFNIK